MKNRTFRFIIFLPALLVMSQGLAMEGDYGLPTKTPPVDIQFLPHAYLLGSEFKELNDLLQEVVKPDSWDDKEEWRKAVEEVSRDLRNSMSTVPGSLRMTIQRALSVLKKLEQASDKADNSDLIISPRNGPSISIQSFDEAIASMFKDIKTHYHHMQNVMDVAKSFSDSIGDFIEQFEECTLDDQIQTSKSYDDQ